MNAVSPPNEVLGELAYLPIFVGMRGRTALLIGGGEAALAKLLLLRRAGAQVRLVAEHLDGAALRWVADDGMISHQREALAPHHFADVVLAIDASEDDLVNCLSVRLAREAGVALNIVDRPKLCDFILPSILDRSPVVVAVSTGGVAPAMARLIRQRLEIAIPRGIGRVALLASSTRQTVRDRLCSAWQRARFWESLFEGPAMQLALAGDMQGAAATAHALIDRVAECKDDAGRVHVLDVTTGDPDLLTVRTARLIRMADIILHEPAIGPAILGLARSGAIKIPVADVLSSDKSREDRARSGKIVVCLRSGDVAREERSASSAG
jgi:uroporphyrin-III C-methyltransferase / precorrin-2 dehydrogenase / sirohydrochlorin ferrochelatase